MRKICIVFGLSVFLTGLGCSAQHSYERTLELAPERALSPLPTLKWYVEHYGEVSSPEVQSFLSSMLKRINGDTSSRIIVLNSQEPMAFTAGGGFIGISTGLLGILRNEAELAFIIAHEISHEILGHINSKVFRDPGSASSADRQELEISADTQALALLMRAHYDPHAALGCLQHTYAAFPDLQLSSSHPEVASRIASLSDLIHKSQWTPPGTIDTREFRIFQKLFSGRS